jgi:myo-inositol 2-dehydrogenase / D-chiro-inositol 1-dehydrogenase
MIGFNRRFDPTFAALKARLDAGEIGKPEMLIITSRDPQAPPVAYIKASGGIFRDMLIHDLESLNLIVRS